MKISDIKINGCYRDPTKKNHLLVFGDGIFFAINNCINRVPLSIFHCYEPYNYEHVNHLRNFPVIAEEYAVSKTGPFAKTIAGWLAPQEISFDEMKGYGGIFKPAMNHFASLFVRAGPEVIQITSTGFNIPDKGWAIYKFRQLSVYSDFGTIASYMAKIYQAR